MGLARGQAQLEAVEQDRDGGEAGVEKLLPVGLDLDAVAEEFEQDTDQLFRILGVLDRREPLEHHFQAAAVSHHVGKFEDVFLVLIVALLAGQVLDELFGGVAEQASHPVDDPHGFTFLGIGKPDSLVDVLHCQVQGDDFVVDLKGGKSNNIFLMDRNH